jgi:hypothetical protein
MRVLLEAEARRKAHEEKGPRGETAHDEKASSWLPESIGAGVEVHSDAGFGAEGY